jgi:hypothetical protein
MMKRMKDIRATVDAPPGMIAQAQQLGAQVQQLAAARLATVDRPLMPVSRIGNFSSYYLGASFAPPL